MKKWEKILWNCFYLLIGIIILAVVVRAFETNQNGYPLFNLVMYGLPVVLLVIHSFLTLTPKRAVFLILLAATVGGLMEYIGLRDGTFFGGQYIYNMKVPMLFTVPLTVILYWAIFIYTGYTITTSFLYFTHQKKPNYKTHNYSLLLLAMLMDALFVVAIDLFMDPLSVRTGDWIWINGGPYFGVPIGNFVGWFTVVVIVSGIFRTFEFFFPQKETMYNKSILIIPVLGYGSLALFFFLKAVHFQMYDLAVLGLFIMLPTVILNLVLAHNSMLHRNSK